MKKVENVLVTLLLVAVLAASFTACGRKADATAPADDNGQTQVAQKNDTERYNTENGDIVKNDIAKNDIAKSDAEKNGAEKSNADKSDADENGLWGSAVYLSDTELGQGSKELLVEVKADDRQVKFTIHTDETTVGAALVANDLIAGDESSYGLYIKKVNGITADYDIDQSYWAFYIDGEYALAGIDSTDITEGAVYQLVYTK